MQRLELIQRGDLDVRVLLLSVVTNMIIIIHETRSELISDLSCVNRILGSLITYWDGREELGEIKEYEAVL